MLGDIKHTRGVPLTGHFIQLGQSQAQSVGSVWTAGREHTDPLTVQPGGLHFGFGAQASIFMKKENYPDKKK